MTPIGDQPDPPVGQPTTDVAANPVVRAVEKAVQKLETAGTFIERDLAEGRADIKDLISRMARIEQKVSDLPSKVWIGSVVLGGMTFLGAFTAVMAYVFGHK